MTEVIGVDTSTFVYADGPLAELLCRVRLIGLTPERAEYLRRIHAADAPDDCPVHLAALQLLADVRQW